MRHGCHAEKSRQFPNVNRTEKIRIASDEYNVKNVNDNIAFSPVKKHCNVFSTASWKNYDYQKDIKNDTALQSIKPVGREIGHDLS